MAIGAVGDPDEPRAADAADAADGATAPDAVEASLGTAADAAPAKFVTAEVWSARLPQPLPSTAQIAPCRAYAYACTRQVVAPAEAASAAETSSTAAALGSTALELASLSAWLLGDSAAAARLASAGRTHFEALTLSRAARSDVRTLLRWACRQHARRAARARVASHYAPRPLPLVGAAPRVEASAESAAVAEGVSSSSGGVGGGGSTGGGSTGSGSVNDSSDSSDGSRGGRVSGGGGGTDAAAGHLKACGHRAPAATAIVSSCALDDLWPGGAARVSAVWLALCRACAWACATRNATSWAHAATALGGRRPEGGARLAPAAASSVATQSDAASPAASPALLLDGLCELPRWQPDGGLAAADGAADVPGTAPPARLIVDGFVSFAWDPAAARELYHRRGDALRSMVASERLAAALGQPCRQTPSPSPRSRSPCSPSPPLPSWPSPSPPSPMAPSSAAGIEACATSRARTAVVRVDRMSSPAAWRRAWAAAFATLLAADAPATSVDELVRHLAEPFRVEFIADLRARALHPPPASLAQGVPPPVRGQHLGEPRNASSASQRRK